MERELFAYAQRALPLSVCDVIDIDVPLVSKTEPGLSLNSFPVCLPHEIFGAMYLQNKRLFREVFLADDSGDLLAEYWQHAESTQ
eukprot:8351327-Alexandrium_andersonii.AAC.1